MIFWFIIFLFLPLTAIRWLRWLAIVQQKEYRLDRLVAFLQSEEGRKDFLRLIPQAKDFTRTGLKRPVKTLRVGLVAVVSGALILMFFFVMYSFGVKILTLAVVATYFFMPLILVISCT